MKNNGVSAVIAKAKETYTAKRRKFGKKLPETPNTLLLSPVMCEWLSKYEAIVCEETGVPKERWCSIAKMDDGYIEFCSMTYVHKLLKAKVFKPVEGKWLVPAPDEESTQNKAEFWEQKALELFAQLLWEYDNPETITPRRGNCS